MYGSAKIIIVTHVRVILGNNLSDNQLSGLSVMASPHQKFYCKVLIDLQLDKKVKKLNVIYSSSFRCMTYH